VTIPGTICLLVDHLGHERYRGPADECYYVSRQLWARGGSTWTVDGKLLQVRAPVECVHGVKDWHSRFAVSPTGIVGETLRFEYEGAEREREEIEEGHGADFAVPTGDKSFLSGESCKKSRRRSCNRPNGWKPEEDVLLRKVVPLCKSMAEIAAHFPTRSERAVHCRISRLKLKTGRHWTAYEDQILISRWDSARVDTIARALKRPLHGTLRRALKLGLSCAIDETREIVTHAAEARGFAPQTLLKMMAACGYRTEIAARGLCLVRRAKFRRHTVDTLEADAAVKAWMAADSIEGWAKHYGISRDRMRRRLDAIGHTKRHLLVGRIRPEWAEKAITAEKLVDIAKRYGVNRQSVRRAIVQLKWKVNRRHDMMLTREDADRLMAAWLKRPLVIAKLATVRRKREETGIKAAA